MNLKWIFLLLLMDFSIVSIFSWERNICSFNIDIRNSFNSIFDKPVVKVNMDFLMKCTILDGDFTMTMIQNVSNYTVFNNIIEITGFLFVFDVNGIKSIGEILPNLRVIGGNSLISGSALVIYQNQDLEYIGLNKLTVIRNGGIRITNNPKLCYSKFIDWHSIVIGDNVNIIVEQTGYSFSANEDDATFHRCQDVNGCKVENPTRCNRIKNVISCWNSTTCQEYCPYHMHGGFLTGSDFIGPGCDPIGDKCHHSCIGGCFTANDSSACYACQKFELNGLCVNECPSNMFVYKTHRCITEKQCQNLYPVRTASRSRKVSWKAFQGQCHFECPEGFQEDTENPYTCLACDQGFCPIICIGGLTDTIEKALQLKNCNIIDGNLTIQLREHDGKKLKTAFKNIREIKGYLLIHYSPVLTSLNVFQNLQMIHGDSLINGRYAFAVFEMENLKQLFNDKVEEHLVIKSGRVSFQNNPKLCFKRIMKFVENVGMKNNISETDISKYGNGEKSICDKYELQVDVKSVTSFYFVLSWNSVNETIMDRKHLLGYMIYYKKVDEIDSKLDIDEDRCACGDSWKMEFIQIIPDKDNGHVTGLIEDLLPNTIYAFYVQAQIIHHSDAKDIVSKVGFAKTYFSIPDSPVWKKYYSFEPDKIILEWNPPLNGNGIITHYIVKWIIQFMESENEETCDPAEKITTLNMMEYPDNIYSSNNKNSEERHYEKSIFEDDILNKMFGFPHEPPVEQSNSRKPRSINETNFTERDNVFYNISESVRVKHPNISGSVNVTATKFVIIGLNYFTKYSIQILACQDITAPENYCTMNARANTVQTQPISKYDVVDSNSVKAYEYTVNRINQQDCRIINWTIPNKPNGQIFGFRYKLWREDNTTSFDRCIKKSDYIKNGGIIIKSLSNGCYNFEIRTVSSAGISEKVVIENLFEVYVPGWLTWERAVYIILCFALIIVIITWIVHRNYKKYLERKVQQYLTISANSEYPQINIYKKDEWELRREDLQLFEEIGRGTFGKVFSGQGKNIVSKGGTRFGKCAIKVIPECASHSERMHLLVEASVMKEFDSKFIVKLYGVVSEGIPVLLVMELMENGNLRDFLRSRRPSSDENLNNAPVPSKISYFKWACQIADGMAYLEAQKFVHRDLAARNCMVSSDETVKIGDFGMARDIYYHEYYKPIGKRFMPVRWMAPECLKDGKFTVKSDVWSYGIVLYEMVTLGQQPYAGLQNEQVYEYIERKRKIIICPTNCPKFWYNLMQKCWSYNPYERPCFYQIFLYLKDTIDKRFKDINEEIAKIYENSFVIQKPDVSEKTIYNFAIIESSNMCKHPLLEELKNVNVSEEGEEANNCCDKISAYVKDDGNAD